MNRVESKPLRVFLLSGADELIGSKHLESLEALGEVVGYQEGLEVFFPMLPARVASLSVRAKCLELTSEPPVTCESP